jgi:phosphoribosylglycinamide formyltransferase 1
MFLHEIILFSVTSLLYEMNTSYLCIMAKKRIALFASGNGSNALNIITHFKHHESIEVGFVLCNNKAAKVIERAEEKGVQVICLSNNEVADGNLLLKVCRDQNIDFIILAGYLRLIPSDLILGFKDRIINLHPALLPKYGGKGMYGNFVHEAVIKNKEQESGITVHLVNEQFDEGRILAQLHCSVEPNETISSLQLKIQQLEHFYFPLVIEHTLLTQTNASCLQV